MSSTSKGNRAEKRAAAILVRAGYKLVAEAKRTPVWKNGRVIANDGNVDLLDGAIDLVFIAPGRRTLFVQVCHVGGESPRRAKLRACGFDPAFHEAQLWSFDLDEQVFRVYRDEADFLAPYHIVPKDASSLPFGPNFSQVTLA